jgi:hypothetical protein
MKQHHPTGLGEPIPTGKLTLFQPPREAGEKGSVTKKPQQEQRIRTTIDLTQEALIILQQVQQEHRLKTGHVLPLWKALSQVITTYQHKST